MKINELKEMDVDKVEKLIDAFSILLRLRDSACIIASNCRECPCYDDAFKGSCKSTNRIIDNPDELDPDCPYNKFKDWQLEFAKLDNQTTNLFLKLENSR